MNLSWLEQTDLDVPKENDWLSDGELCRLDTLRIPKRRSDWRLGRWTAKATLAACQKLPLLPGMLRRVEIRAAHSGEPELFLDGTPSAATLSLSHCCGRALCVIAPPGISLGCDLERIEPHSEAFLGDYFTEEEQVRVTHAPAQDRARLTALLWSGKESALKALHEGLRLSSRSVIVQCENGSSDPLGWSRLHVLYTGGRSFHGWWRQADGMVRTLVADPSPARPIRLPDPACCADPMTVGC